TLGFNYFSTVTKPGTEDFDVATGTGTSYVNMVKGTLTYLEEKKIKAKKVTVIGFVAFASERSKYGHDNTKIEFYRRAPTIAEVKTALQLRAIVVQHYGHYDFKANPARAGSGGKARPFLRRTGGHYITPIGFGLDKNGKQSADTLISYDPAGSYQDAQHEVYTDWMRQPKSAYQNIPLLNPIGSDPARDKAFVDPNWPRYERYGTLNQTYLMDTTLQTPKENAKYDVMEGLIVIEV
ncbi:MAG TPA: hypothetical protein VNI20_11475, partial [Fimbriimonadaceae bacterium]|nr:hypothetical protein [Fimbriimonadaceae bacterium]